MRFGFSFWVDHDGHEVADWVAAAEEAGFDFAWFPDHYFLREVYSVQALAAEKTSRILLATGVTSPYLRHPALLASAVATLDEISGGRAVFGIGAGGFEFAAQLGVHWKRPLTGCRESVEIIRGLLRGEEVTFSGKEFTVQGAKLPFGKSFDISVYYAARGTKMLELSGETGDGVITHGVTPALARYASEVIARSVQAAGRNGKDVDLAIQCHVAISDDPKGVVERLKPACLMMAGGEYSLDLVPLYGLTLEEVAPLREAVRAGDHRKAVGLVNERMVRAFSVVGTPEECVSQIREMADGGVTQLIVSSGGKWSGKEIVENIRRVGEKIIPHFR
ncbi:MAG: LLM class flavin-dependent oxidoreductase [bacterium]